METQTNTRPSRLFSEIRFGLLPGATVQRRLDQRNVSKATLRKWSRAGWIEDRGEWVLTIAGYNA